jgi:hypothetical protein
VQLKGTTLTHKKIISTSPSKKYQIISANLFLPKLFYSPAAHSSFLFFVDKQTNTYWPIGHHFDYQEIDWSQDEKTFLIRTLNQNFFPNFTFYSIGAKGPKIIWNKKAQELSIPNVVKAPHPLTFFMVPKSSQIVGVYLFGNRLLFYKAKLREYTKFPARIDLDPFSEIIPTDKPFFYIKVTNIKLFNNNSLKVTLTLVRTDAHQLTLNLILDTSPSHSIQFHDFNPNQ